MLTELVQEVRVYEGGRLEIRLNFQDELQVLATDAAFRGDRIESIVYDKVTPDSAIGNGR